MGKKILVSFADHRYANAMERLARETANFGFDERYFWSEKDLPQGFFDGFSPKLYRRGFGYWIWKPYIIMKVMKNMREGDILVYSDCGNRWIIDSYKRYLQYIAMLKQDKPLVAFQQQHLEKDWTKGDVFYSLCPNNWKKYAVTLQLWGGCFMLMKTFTTESLVKKWYELSLSQRDLFTDKKSSFPNLLGFQENRHDQSVFSLLVKQIPHTEISWDEVDDLDGKWENFGKFPIQAKREHRISRKNWFLNRILLRPYHYLQGEYLILFKNFHFAKRKIWMIIFVLVTEGFKTLNGGVISY